MADDHIELNQRVGDTGSRRRLYPHVDGKIAAVEEAGRGGADPADVRHLYRERVEVQIGINPVVLRNQEMPIPAQKTAARKTKYQP